MASGREAELKQQGAYEAARDPNSNVTAKQAEKSAVEEAKAGGSAAFQFDPNATAEEKAAQVNSYIPADLQHHRTHQVAALASDTDDGTPSQYQNVLPPVSSGKDGVVHATDVQAEQAANGNLAGLEEDGEDWSRAGWAPRFGPGIPGGLDMQTTMSDTSTWLEERLEDKFFGDWYHNAGIIIFACLSSWVVAVLGGGLGWIFIIMAFCSTYYRTSLRRVRRNFRDDINRELAKARLETDHETLEWINSFLVKFWPIYAPVLCKTIISSVDQVLSTATPAFLDSLRMTSFTLGTKPPRLEHVRTYPKTEDDTVLMDWKFSFTPNDTADMTARQIKVKQNPKVVLEVRVGKAMISKGLDVIVEDMACSGIMRVKVKLQLPFPHIEKIDVCFLERPTLDYVCKPLGGDMFGFDINFIPGLEGFIQEMIHANLGPMMYAPNVFPIEVAKILAGNPVDQAIGVLQIQFHGAMGLRNPDPLAGTPDPYATVSVNNRTELGRTKTVHENANPRWNETVHVILSSLKDTLNIKIYDYNEFRKDKELGEATFALDRFEADDEYENEQLEVLANGKARGLVQADFRFFPVLGGTKLQDGTEEPPPESSTGIVKFTVEQAKDLDGSKSLIGALNPYAVLLLNGKEVAISQKLKRTNNPIWTDASKELLITNRKTAKLGLVIKDDRDLATDPILGTYQIKLDDMMELTEKGEFWYNLANAQNARAKMMVQWRPVALRGALAGSGGYIMPIGVIRIHFKNARELRNVETVGKSDPYARVLLSGIQKGRTVTWKNNLNPDWDEVIYVPVHAAREKLTVEVMDEENVGKDRSLGHFDISVGDYLHQQESGEYAVHDTKENIAQPLLSAGPGRAAKGTINYTCSFFPTIPVVDPEEEAEEKEEAPQDKLNVNGDQTTRRSIESSAKSFKSANGDGTPIKTGALRPRSNTSGTIASLKTTNSSASADMAKKLAAGEKEQDDALPVVKEVPKIKLSAENLIDYESGLLVFKLISGELAKANCVLEIIMDDMVFPAYSTHKVKTKSYEFNETGDAIVRELAESRITLRLVEQADKEGKGEETHVLAKLTGPTLATLERCLYQPTELRIPHGDGHESKITVSLKYLPIKMKLDPSESVNNMGNLRVDVCDAADLPAADRNGFSDPYCKFILDGKDVYKTDKQKKTLHPAWNETFDVAIRSRTAAKFEVHVYDWDFGDKADFLGKAAINLEMLEPFQRQEVKLALDGASGVVRLNLLFKPDFVQRTRQGSSTFQGTFAVPGKIVGAPVKGVGKVGSALGGGVMKFGRGFTRRKSRGESSPGAGLDTSDSGINTPANGEEALPVISIDGPGSSGAPLPGTPSPHARNTSAGANSLYNMYGTSPGGAESGTASLSILSASGFPPSANIQAHIALMGGSRGREKDVHKTKAIKAADGTVNWGEAEAFKTSCTADGQFRIVVKDHSTFGRDDELGEGTFFVSDQGRGSEQTVNVGSGKVTVRSSFTPADAMSTATSPKARRSIFGASSKRDSRERSFTPSGP
ncbi:hypothetical protein FKW77_008263 [Venturia effusa]|uniref:Tricalbin n=1 Tax=Venturia effusa TaxID=50376 RepID=A0A517L3V3_9PEZI|nr:hypothetical protein FKW77_008263 [Venturia effusa]